MGTAGELLRVEWISLADLSRCCHQPPGSHPGTIVTALARPPARLLTACAARRPALPCTPQTPGHSCAAAACTGATTAAPARPAAALPLPPLLLLPPPEQQPGQPLPLGCQVVAVGAGPTGPLR